MKLFSVLPKIDLELPQYTDNRGDNRGAKKLMFKPEQELKDPFPVK